MAAQYIQLRTVLAESRGQFHRPLPRRSGRRGDRGHLAAVEDSLEQFASRNRIVALEEQASEEVRRLAELEAERQAIQRERAALAGLVGRVEEARPSSGRGSGGRRGAAVGSVAGSARYRDLASFPTFLQQGPVSQLVSTLVELENERGALASQRRTDTVS